MSYELLRYGDGHEMHVVARLDPAGELLGILSVKQQCVNIYAEERVYELLVKDLGLELPRLTMNDIDNSYGTAAERKYIPGAEEVVTNYAFADPHNLPTLEDVIELARYERALQYRYDRSIFESFTLDNWRADDFIDMLEDLHLYAEAGNHRRVELIIKVCEEYAPELYSDELNAKLAETRQLLVSESSHS